MAKFRKKPVVIDAVLWDGNLETLEQLGCWSLDTTPTQCLTSFDLEIETLEGVVTAKVGDYVIKGVQQELYPCKPDIFAATYEAAE